ncbi:MAG TPA: hypothetical protein VIS06_10055 [Mycobacteriales bacterium]
MREIRSLPEGHHVITYRAMLDVPRHVEEHLARLLAAHRRRIRA